MLKVLSTIHDIVMIAYVCINEKHIEYQPRSVQFAAMRTWQYRYRTAIAFQPKDRVYYEIRQVLPEVLSYQWVIRPTWLSDAVKAWCPAMAHGIFKQA